MSSEKVEEKRQWIADGLGTEAQALEWMILPSAGEEAVFLRYIDGGKLAISEDGLRAFVAISDPELEDPDHLARLLRHFNIEKLHLPVLKLLGHRGNSAEDFWIEIAAGERPVQAGEEQIVGRWPGDEKAELKPEDLRLRTAHLLSVLAAGSPAKRLEGLSLPLACKGDVVAGIRRADKSSSGRDVFGRLWEAGEQVPSALAIGQGLLWEGEQLKAMGCGYLTQVQSTLELRSPLWISPDWMEVCWLLLDHSPRQFPEEMVQRCLRNEGVREGIDSEKIGAVVSLASKGGMASTAVEIAKGGNCLELAEGIRPVGGLRQGVKRGEVVARCRREGVGDEVFDVRGCPGNSSQADPVAIRPGHNLVKGKTGGQETFLAACDGMVSIFQGSLNVHALLEIPGDVDSQSGLLEYGGSADIEGSVLRGGGLKICGDIDVHGRIDGGGEVVLGQDLSASRGIVGRGTNVRSGGKISTHSILEATVEAGGDIRVDSWMRNASIVSGGTVTLGLKDHAGVMRGGRVYAARGVLMPRAGSEEGEYTLIAAGLTRAESDRLERLGQYLAGCLREIQFVRKKLGLEEVDMQKILKRLQASRGLHKKMLSRIVRRLVEQIVQYQKASRKRDSLNAELKRRNGVEVCIEERLEPGVEVRLGAEWKRFDVGQNGLHWRLEHGELVDLNFQRDL